MMPFLQIGSLNIATSQFLTLVVFALSWVILSLSFRNGMLALKHFFLLLFVGVSSLFGARLFHIILEKPALIDQGLKAFQRLDGMVFYGAFFMGFLSFLLFAKLFYQKHQFKKLFDIAVILTAMSYGFLRIACFASGCCWGKLTAVPWAVQFFHPHSITPLRGLPLHPVQLYDAAWGFLMMSIMIGAYRRMPRGQMLALFCVLYPVGRFITEFYRGDSFRGDNLLFGLSTSQWLSIPLFIYGVHRLLPTLKSKKLVNSILSMTSLLLLTGCLDLPEPPSSELFSVYKKGYVEEMVFKSQDFTLEVDGQEVPFKKKKRNLLFLAADDYIQDQFLGKIQDTYNSEEPLRLEDLVWWQYAPLIDQIYNYVIRVPYSSVSYGAIYHALNTLEKRKEPYDVVLLTHGYHNHISSGSNGYLLSYQELEVWKGQLKHLNLVFMQACFGQTLVDSWKQTGAKNVLSYDGFNRNFFYLEFFLRNYRLTPDNIEMAYERTNSTLPESLKQNKLYKKLISKGLGLGVEEYLEHSPNPNLN